MKIIVWCVAIIIWWQAPLHAQVKQLTGRLTGPGGKVLPQASVTLRNNKHLIVQYAISNDKGAFQLSIADTLSWVGLLLEVTHLGYQKMQMPLQEGRYQYDLQLDTQADLLSPVEVKSQPAMARKGDTTSYNVRSFSQEEDRSIGDVLRRMPGIEVGDDGKIYYNGKEVSNLYIHGDDLMDGRYGLATRVINKELIQSVDVIQNHQPVKVLQNKVPSDDVAINLVLKNENSMALTGQAMLGGGWPTLYDAAFNTILLNKRIKMINALKSNNSGIDYQGDMAQQGRGGLVGSGGGASPVNLLSAGTVSGPDLPRRNYYLNRSGIAHINTLFNAKNGLQYRVNLQAFADRQTFDYSSVVQQYIAGDTILYREQQSSLRKPWLVNGGFTVMANKLRYFLRDQLQVKVSGEQYNSHLASNAQPFDQQLRSREQSFSNELSYKPALKNNSMLDIRLFNSYAVNPQRLYVGAGLHQEILNENLSFNALQQQARMPTWFHALSLGYILPQKLITQEYAASFSTELQTLESALQLMQSDGAITAYKGDAGNDLRWQRNLAQVTGKYALNKGRFDAALTVPVSWQEIRYRQPDYQLDKNYRQFFINPSGYVKYRLNVEDHLELNYNYDNNMGNIAGVYRGAVLSNYRSLRANEADLQEMWSSGGKLSYHFQRTIIMLFINAGIGYTKNSVNSLYSSIITNNIQRSILLPYQNDQSGLMATAGISKYFFGLKSTVALKGTVNRGRYNQLMNEQLLPYTNQSTGLQMTIESKPLGKVGLRYHGNIVWNNSWQSLVAPATGKVTNRMHRLDQNVVMMVSPLKSVYMNLSARHMYSRQGSGDAVRYLFVDLNLRYRHKPWRTDFEFDCNNLANIRDYGTYRVSSNLSSAAQYQIRGRMATLRATFNL